MGEWTTLSVRDGTRDRFNNLKSQMNEEHLPEMSADVFLNSLMDTLEAVEGGYYKENQQKDVDVSAIADEVANQISMANEPGVEIDTQKLINRIDDLETELTTQHESLKR